MFQRTTRLQALAEQARCGDGAAAKALSRTLNNGLDPIIRRAMQRRGHQSALYESIRRTASQLSSAQEAAAVAPPRSLIERVRGRISGQVLALIRAGRPADQPCRETVRL